MELLKKIISSLKDYQEFNLKMYDYGIVIDARCIEDLTSSCFDCIKQLYGDSVCELVEWWLYEDVEKEIYYKDETIDVASLDNLIEYIKTIA